VRPVTNRGADADVVALHARAVERFLTHVRAVPGGAWDARTPCGDWTVRDLVHHVVAEERWTVLLLDGATIEQVGDSLDGDLLGPRPKDAAVRAGTEAVAAVAVPGALNRMVHLSFGDTSAEDYAWQLFADHLVHGWDLAAATGRSTALEEDLVDACARWWAGSEDAYRRAGAVGQRVAVGPDVSRQDLLLSAFGRDPAWRPS
jgi:uncharacterized protein (TIGR03086 family)